MRKELRYINFFSKFWVYISQFRIFFCKFWVNFPQFWFFSQNSEFTFHNSFAFYISQIGFFASFSQLPNFLTLSVYIFWKLWNKISQLPFLFIFLIPNKIHRNFFLNCNNISQYNCIWMKILQYYCICSENLCTTFLYSKSTAVSVQRPVGNSSEDFCRLHELVLYWKSIM